MSGGAKKGALWPIPTLEGYLSLMGAMASPAASGAAPAAPMATMTLHVRV